MSDEEEDYMSSEFLNVTEDIRPGLVLSKQLKRKYEVEKKRIESNKLHRTKSQKELEAESREAGLENAISSDNKGFAMLEKMGYKPGMKLGVEKVGSAGLVEPIKIHVKTGRSGLGREEEIRQKIAEREKRQSKMKVYKEEEIKNLTREFQERMRKKNLERYLIADLRKSRVVCQQLDMANSTTEPMRSWFWTSHRSEEDDEEEEEEEEEEEVLEPDEQLAFILDYLRGKYCYCLWCGLRYDSEDDLNQNCPGIDKEDHDE